MKNEPTTYTVIVADDKTGKRLDRLLADSLPMLSRSRIKGLIATGKVHLDKIDGIATQVARRVNAGECYTITIPGAAPAIPEPEDIPLDVIYEDSDLIVINKPQGLVVHPAAGNQSGTLVNALLHHCGDSLSGIGGVGRPGIVHRLDKDTSGLMVVAKNDQAHIGLSKQFEAHSLERAYYALVWGRPNPPSGTVVGNIGRSQHDRKKMAIVPSGGKHAVTHFKTVEAVGSLASLVECRLETGRTHQIRVHMASIDHPVIGDPVYGGADLRRLRGEAADVRDKLSTYKYQALHAYLIGFEHPVTGETLRFQSNKPNNINDLMIILGEV